MLARHALARLLCVLALLLTASARTDASESRAASVQGLYATHIAATSPGRAPRAPRRATSSMHAAAQCPRARASTALGEVARPQLPPTRGALLADARRERGRASGGITTYALIADIRGSVRLVVNAATGVVAQRIDYGPFGEVIADTAPAPCVRIVVTPSGQGRLGVGILTADEVASSPLRQDSCHRLIREVLIAGLASRGRETNPQSDSMQRSVQVEDGQRMVGPAEISANRLAQEIGIGQPTLSKWLRDAGGRMPGVKFASPPPPPRSPRRSEDWSPEGFGGWRISMGMLRMI